MRGTTRLLVVLAALTLAALPVFASGGSEVPGAASIKEFVTITHHMMGNPPTNGQLELAQDEWNKILKDKVNAAMVIKWIDWTDWFTKYNLLLASGEAVDLIHSSSTWLDMWPNVQRGAFLVLDNLIPKYAPQTWKEIPQADWEQTKYQGKIYSFPENNYTQYVNHGLYYRGDWAKEFGITSHIADFETMGKYFQGIADKKKGVIPWDVAATQSPMLVAGWPISKTDAVDIRIATGAVPLFWAKSYTEKYTVWDFAFDQSYLDFAKMMKAWGDAGYWRDDALNFKGDTRAELRAGQSGSDQHHSNTYRYLRIQMDKDQPGSDLQMFAWADTRSNLVGEPITHGATSIGAHSKNPERAVMIYELLRQNEQIYRLLNFGREGVQYNIKDGKLVRPAGYDDARDGFYSDYWGGRVDKFELRTDTEWLPIWDVWKGYDKIKKPFPYGRFVFDKTPIENELAAVTEVCNQLGPAISYGKAGDPVKAVDDLRAKLKLAGYDKLRAEIQRQLTAFQKTVEGK
jgi:putative aldouronate transport system substrate-binding protein